jgi:hypothetical protein
MKTFDAENLHARHIENFDIVRDGVVIETEEVLLVGEFVGDWITEYPVIETTAPTTTHFTHPPTTTPPPTTTRTTSITTETQTTLTVSTPIPTTPPPTTTTLPPEPICIFGDWQIGVGGKVLNLSLGACSLTTTAAPPTTHVTTPSHTTPTATVPTTTPPQVLTWQDKSISISGLLSYAGNWDTTWEVPVDLTGKTYSFTLAQTGGPTIFSVLDSGFDQNQLKVSITKTGDVGFGAISTYHCSIVIDGQVYHSLLRILYTVTLPVPREYNHSSISADGTKALVITWPRMLTSTDGMNLVALTASEGTHYWESGVISDNGVNLIVGDGNGSLYYSNDSGATFGVASTNADWLDIVSNSTCEIAYAIRRMTEVHKTTDYGVTWTIVYTSTTRLGNIAMGGDNIFLTNYDDNHIHYSNDGGTTWNISTTNISNPNDIACNADGSIVVVSAQYGVMGVSTDYGQSFSLYTNSLGKLAISDTGQHMYALDSAGISYSSDHGVTWTSIHDQPNPYASWMDISCSADGSKILACFYSGYYPSGGYAVISNDFGSTWHYLVN